MEISTMECVPIDQVDSQAVAAGLTEANRRMATAGQLGEAEKAEITIHHDVYQALTNALSKK